MKRRKFLQVSSLLTLGSIAAQPLLAQTETPDCLSSFSGHNFYSSDKQDKYKLIIKMCSDAVNFFDKALEAEKNLELIIYKVGASLDDLTYIYNAYYTITSSKSRSNDTNLFDVSAEQINITKESTEIPKQVNLKNLNFMFRFNNQDPLYKITLVDKNDYTFVELSKDSSDDCFLTTACVNAMHKTDDCEELTKLRQFRDTHLLATESGKNLVKEYYAIAPTIVQNINKQSEALTIYTQIYSRMIQPTLHHIEQGAFDEAIEVYKNYTYQLKATYAKEG